MLLTLRVWLSDYDKFLEIVKLVGLAALPSMTGEICTIKKLPLLAVYASEIAKRIAKTMIIFGFMGTVVYN